MATIGKLHEHTFNVSLGEALRNSNARWRENRQYIAVERRSTMRGSAKRPDILVNDPRMPKVAIECAFGGDKDKDAAARLEHNGIETSIAVNVPKSFASMDEDEARAALAEGAELGYAVLQKDFRFPLSGYIQGAASDLAAVIPVASVTKRRLEKLAGDVAELINDAAAALEERMAMKDCKGIADAVYQRSTLTAFRTVLILWFDAMLVQAHLHSQGQEDIDELPLPGEVIPSKLAETWRRIIDTNWRSIFKPAVKVLENSARKERGATSKALNFLLEAVEVVESAQIGDHVNLGAELFPKISEDRKTAAAFYTTPATAELLAALTIREHDGHDWSNKALFQTLQVADLACGTGTLLRAAYRRIRSIHEASGGSLESSGQLHKDAMEKGVTGADVSPVAAHLTNSSMAVMGGGMPYGNTHIGWVNVGAPAAGGGALTTGSLEFLRENSVDDLLGGLGGTTGGSASGCSPIMVLNDSLDYILMNPPYSRTRGGQSAFDIAGLTDEERQECQRRWGNLLRWRPALPAVMTAGMAASFLCLAYKKIKPGGRIGFVLPLSAAFDDSWSVTREMIVREFSEIAAIVRAGSKGGAEALSADTHMGEMLLVATRKEKQHESDSTSTVRCVTLRRMPRHHGEAGEFGRSVKSALTVMRSHGHPVLAGDEELGQIATMRLVGGEPWSHLGALHADLALSAKRIADDGVLPGEDGDMRFRCPMTVVGDLFEVGPTHDLIGHPYGGDGRGAYVFHPITRKAEIRGSNRALWKADASEQRCLVIDPTHKGTLWNKTIARRIKWKSGRLHYARGMRWTSQALLVASTKAKVFGGRGWVSLLHQDANMCDAFALWANSTLGLITHWTQGSRTQLGRAPAQVKAIHAMPCPDLSKLSAAVLQKAASTFEELCSLPLKSACQAHADQNRAKIDIAVIVMLGLPKKRALEAVSALREWWCAEPTVHGDNKTALRLLEEAGLAGSVLDETNRR